MTPRTPSADLEIALAPSSREEDYLATARFVLPDGLDEQQFEPAALRIDRAHLRSLDRGSPEYGLALRDALFGAGPLRDALLQARATSLGAGLRLRLRLRLPEALQPLCWEALSDPHNGRPLAFQSNLLLSRYLSRDDWGELRLRPRGQVRALVAVAGPADLSAYRLAPIDVPGELARARDALAGISVAALPDAGRPCSLAQLRQQLFADDGYAIVYLLAHGALSADGPIIYLESDSGQTAPTPGERLVELVRSLDERRPALVVLASCESAGDGYAGALAALGPQLARAGVPAVLAMQGRVSGDTASAFAATFFDELMRDGEPDRAAAVARLAVGERPDWWMPVLYTRLRRGSIWRDEAQPPVVGAAPARPGPPPGYETLPPQPGLVVGREAQLALLKARLGIGQDERPGRPQTITTIHGFPGQGKTTLALALAYDPAVRRAFPGGVLWADLGENPQVNLHGELARWGDALHSSRVREAPDLAEATRRLVALLHARRALLIVDDVWQKEHGAVFARARGSCPLVLTTRAAEIAEYMADASDDRMRLPGLDLETGVELLSRLAPSVVRQFGPECRVLVAAVEGLPLALQVAGRLLREDHELQLVDMRARIAELLSGKLLEAELPYQLVRETNNLTVAAVLRRSVDYLDAETRERFIILGAFAPKPATFDLSDIAAAWATSDPAPTVRRLIHRGLLERASAEGPSFQMHALLADMARSLLDSLYL